MNSRIRPAREGQGPRSSSNRPGKVKPVSKVATPRPARDWQQVNRSLVDRGNLTVLVDPAVLGTGRAVGYGAGRGRPYPAQLLVLAVIAAACYRLPLRQTQGFLLMLARLLDVDGNVPDYTTICRRRKTLELPAMPTGPGPLVLVIDASGITVRSPGRWIEERTRDRDPRRIKYVKLHVGIDAGSGELVASVITEADGPGSGDVSVGPALISCAGQRTKVSAVLADRAYDALVCYQAAEDIGSELFTVPKDNAAYGLHPDRDQHLAQVGRLGPPEWKRRTGYGQRSQVEAWFSAFKRATSDRVRARTGPGINAELQANLWTYNTWNNNH